MKKEFEKALADFRHAYFLLRNGCVKEDRQALFAQGLLGPAIERLERLGTKLPD
jgi:hypothetical protein